MALIYVFVESDRRLNTTAIDKKKPVCKRKLRQWKEFQVLLQGFVKADHWLLQNSKCIFSPLFNPDSG
jgi:hypothetical protein